MHRLIQNGLPGYLCERVAAKAFAGFIAVDLNTTILNAHPYISAVSVIRACRNIVEVTMIVDCIVLPYKILLHAVLWMRRLTGIWYKIWRFFFKGFVGYLLGRTVRQAVGCSCKPADEHISQKLR